MTKIGRPIEETPLAGRVRSWGDPSCAAHRLWTLAVHKMSPSFSVAYSAWSASDQKSAIGRPRMAFSPASGWMRRAHIRLGCMRRVEALWGQITPSDRHPALLADNSTCGLSLTGRNGSCSGLGAGVVFGKNLKIPTTSALVFASDVVRGKKEMKAILEKGVRGQVHCPICTHTVPAVIDIFGKRARVSPGQRCPRCAASLDVAIVVQVAEAA